MKLSRSIFFFLIFLIFLSGSAELSLACGCGNPEPVCEAFGKAKAVFVGRVIGAQSPQGTADSLATGVTRQFIFNVKESFIGVETGKTISIFTGSGFGDCGFPFKEGETYLVYAYQRNGLLITTICNRSRHISKVKDEDFNFLRNLRQDSPGAKLFGNVNLYAKTSFEENYIAPLPGLKLSVEQTNDPRKHFEIYTDKAGKYEIDGLPAGKYKITPFLPEHFNSSELRSGFKEFEVNDKGCYKQDFLVKSESFVSVKVVDSDGAPVTNIWVEFTPVNIKARPAIVSDIEEFGVTNPQGEFYEFDFPPGQYTISVNYFYSPDRRRPFPATFYPNAADRSKAQIINIEPGTKIENLVIKLPPRLIEKEVIGSIMMEDGSAAVQSQVYLEDDERHESCINGCHKTDLGGNFVLSGFEGQTYRVIANAEKIVNGKSIILRAESAPFVLKENLSIPKLTLSLKKIK